MTLCLSHTTETPDGSDLQNLGGGSHDPTAGVLGMLVGMAPHMAVEV